ncbi:class I SAM-dependent methyltransferase [candidate division WOR-3 bacterium]|nr:class I SAM-dependent methyltransferase [candidate division WOR-3 bacterium]
MKNLFIKARRKYEAFLSFVMRNKLEITIFNPRYLANYYLNKSIYSSTAHARGILLDVGCGNKPYIKLFKSRIDRYFGLDSPKTSQVMAGAKPEIIGDVNFSLPIKSKSIDTILLLQVLEHLNDPENTISEAWRVLKNRGCLILSTRQIYPVHGEPYDFFRYTRYGLKYLIEKNGFHILKMEANGSLWSTIGAMFNIWVFSYLFRTNNKKLNRLLLVLKALLTPFLLMLFALTNLLCLGLDNLFPKIDNFASNWFILAKKS